MSSRQQTADNSLRVARSLKGNEAIHMLIKNLYDCTRTALATVAESLGQRPFVTDQLYRWMYQQGATTFEAMTNIAGDVRTALAAQYALVLPRIVETHTSTDGTTKYLLQLADGQRVETVYIPVERAKSRPRRTLCISTQVGCAMGCRFCHTATMGLRRHLTQGEILGQIIAVQHQLPPEFPPTNIVFMGMGEPLHNYNATRDALQIMTDDRGLGFGRRRVTVSTVGIPAAIRRLGKERLGVKLALSLHATTDEQRQQLIPLAKSHSLLEVLDACHDYCRDQGRGTCVTFEYLLLREVNDTMEDAKRLVQLSSRVPAKINLIPWNPYPGAPWKRPEDERITQFAEHLRSRNLQVNIRQSRGRDILAACGQLATRATHASSSRGTQ